MFTYNVEARGLAEQIRKLESYEQIAAAEYGAAMQQAVMLAERETKVASPVDRGRLRSSLAGRVMSIAGSNVVGVVGTNVNHNGFPYPGALDEGDRYHYRAGPRAGQPTRGWFSETLKGLFDSFEKFFAAATERIAERLQVRG